MAAAATMEQLSHLPETKMVVVAVPDGTEQQELHGQLADVVVQEQAGLHTDADTAAIKIDKVNIKGRSSISVLYRSLDLYISFSDFA